MHSVRGDVLGVPSWRPQDPVGVQAVHPGAGGNWKREAGVPGKEDSPSGRSRREYLGLRAHDKCTDPTVGS